METQTFNIFYNDFNNILKTKVAYKAYVNLFNNILIHSRKAVS